MTIEFSRHIYQDPIIRTLRLINEGQCEYVYDAWLMAANLMTVFLLGLVFSVWQYVS